MDESFDRNATKVMMKIVMPQLGETVTEGTVAKWHKNVGDPSAGRRTAVRSRNRKGDHRDPGANGQDTQEAGRRGSGR